MWKELLELYVEAVGVRLPLLCAEYKTKFIGIYSPVHRCLQSSFALTFAQLIAEKHPALYLNFEHCNSEKRKSGLYSADAQRAESAGNHTG